jgi:hypothetical protein
MCVILENVGHCKESHLRDEPLERGGRRFHDMKRAKLKLLDHFSFRTQLFVWIDVDSERPFGVLFDLKGHLFKGFVDRVALRKTMPQFEDAVTVSVTAAKELNGQENEKGES